MKGTENVSVFFLGLLLATASVADGNPIYSEQTEVLSIPSVDAIDRPGFYQDVRVEFVTQDLWRLEGVEEGKEIDEIEHVELIKTDTFPMQAFLRVEGTFTSGCQEIGKVSQRLIDNTFEVAVYYENNEWTRAPTDIVCPQVLVPFSRVIPLRVYSLEAGTYDYSVNGEHEGAFEIQVLNELD